MLLVRLALIMTMLAGLLPAQTASSGGPLRLAIAGLVHGHASGFLRMVKERKDVEIVGVYDPSRQLHQKYASEYGLADKLFYTDLAQMLDAVKPEAVATFSSTFDHPMVVEAAASRKIPVMMEKPLAVSNEAAQRIKAAADRSGIAVIVNYETTWYASHEALWQVVKQQKVAGEIRKMVALDGHQGPKEIGVSPEFLEWLSDPVKNGGGALFDFGCYGANLMTWLMDNQRPIAVTAITQQIKPSIYPKVDDEATIIVEYPHAQGIIEGSWNWPYSRKDLEVYGARGFVHAIGGTVWGMRLPGQQQEERGTPAALPEPENNPVSYLKAIARGQLKPTGLSSLANNMIVTEILDAARESAKTGKRVVLK